MFLFEFVQDADPICHGNKIISLIAAN